MHQQQPLEDGSFLCFCRTPKFRAPFKALYVAASGWPCSYLDHPCVYIYIYIKSGIFVAKKIDTLDYDYSDPHRLINHISHSIIVLFSFFFKFYFYLFGIFPKCFIYFSKTILFVLACECARILVDIVHFGLLRIVSNLTILKRVYWGEVSTL